ncbi:piggyBac transposable element-derived protein 4-like [Nilaparvata lugens]|uniref:piggyBac transposable element-derived protein 4-like n=1 Tax=Nilaparvata lugens TaxID=108931 RepID=UPI00193DF3C4|nr:piggyBac transposable element-derived protein 4-like [Nilaparvata lugens]
MARFIDPKDFDRVLNELESEEERGEQNDFEDDIDFEAEVIEHDRHNSESENDLEEPMEVDEAPVMREEEENLEGLRFFIGKNGDTLWANRPLHQTTKTKAVNIIKTIPGPKGEARKCKSRSECFLKIISESMIQKIVEYTNIFISKQKDERKNDSVDEDGFRDRDYRPTTREEVLALFGALFLIAVKRGNRSDVSEFFTTNGTGLTILRANFSERRFRMLLRSLRFDDITTRVERSLQDKLAPIREFHASFIENCQSAYNVGECITIDEMLVAFRGRCSFIQYMPQKPAKYGLKIYASCDSQTFYTNNMLI